MSDQCQPDTKNSTLVFDQNTTVTNSNTPLMKIMKENLIRDLQDKVPDEIVQFMTTDLVDPINQLDRTKPVPHDKLALFPHRFIVAGSRGWDDVEMFTEIMLDELDRPSVRGQHIVFISGNAKSGADKLIIDFCKKHGLFYSIFDADWDTHQKAAGYIRNVEMSKYGNRLITFWDGRSKGTKHMIDIAAEKEIKAHKFIVHVTPPVKSSV